MQEAMTIAAILLANLGITDNYKGYHYCMAALEILFSNPDPFLQITNDIYPLIAGRYGTSIANVERCIRTIISICWNDGNQALLKRLCPLRGKPSNFVFLSALRSKVLRQVELTESAERKALDLAEQ